MVITPAEDYIRRLFIETIKRTSQELLLLGNIRQAAMNFSTNSAVITEITNWTYPRNETYTNWTYPTEETYTTTVAHTSGGHFSTGGTFTTGGTYTTPGTHTVHHEQMIQIKMWQMAVFVSLFGVAFITALFASLRKVLGRAFRRIRKAPLKRGEEASGLLKAEQKIENQIKDVEEEFKTGNENQGGSVRPSKNENTHQPAPETEIKGAVNWL